MGWTWVREKGDQLYPPFFLQVDGGLCDGICFVGYKNYDTVLVSCWPPLAWCSSWEVTSSSEV